MHPAAPQSLLASRPNPAVRVFFILSVGFHVLVVVLGIGYARLNTAPPMVLDQKPIKATLVRLGKKRDEKFLPRKETPPPPPKEVQGAKAPEPPPVEPVKPAVAVPIPNVKPTPETAKKQSGEKEGADRRSALFGAFDKVGKQAEELEGDPDGDPDGDSAIQEGERYYGLLNAQVRRRYDLPDTISEQERMYLRAQVMLKIGRSGEVVTAKLSKSSGNDLFDAAVISAVRKASPFSPPPDTLRESLAEIGVVLEFKP